MSEGPIGRESLAGSRDALVRSKRRSDGLHGGGEGHENPAPFPSLKKESDSDRQESLDGRIVIELDLPAECVDQEVLKELGIQKKSGRCRACGFLAEPPECQNCEAIIK